MLSRSVVTALLKAQRVWPKVTFQEVKDSLMGWGWGGRKAQKNLNFELKYKSIFKASGRITDPNDHLKRLRAYIIICFTKAMWKTGENLGDGPQSKPRNVNSWQHCMITKTMCSRKENKKKNDIYSCFLHGLIQIILGWFFFLNIRATLKSILLPSDPKY